MEDPDPDPSGPAAAFERFEERLAAMEATSASLAASVAALLARLDGAAEERHPAEQAGSLRLPIIMLAWRSGSTFVLDCDRPLGKSKPQVRIGKASSSSGAAADTAAAAPSQSFTFSIRHAII